MQVIAKVTSYQQLIDGMREWLRKLGSTFLEIDRLAGWPDGYASKIFAPRPQKKLGHKSWPLTFAATGTKLLLVVDEEQLAKIKSRLAPRSGLGPDIGSAAIRFNLSKRFLREIGAKGGQASACVRRRKAQRRQAAQRAAQARWARRAG